MPFSHSGLLYLNDDFQGGDLFFTEPNALTVRVSRVKGVGFATGSPAVGLGFKIEGPQRQIQGNGWATLTLSFPPSPLHYLSVFRGSLSRG